jgi:predicted nucleic-acid-binding protein
MTSSEPETIYLIDTNVILRYLLDDHPEFSPKAIQFMLDVSKGKFRAEIADIVLMECIFVMEKHYKIPRSLVVDRLVKIVNFEGIINTNKAILINALLSYEKHKIDIVDCLLCSYSSDNRIVVSFDKDFNTLNAYWKNL